MKKFDELDALEKQSNRKDRVKALFSWRNVIIAVICLAIALAISAIIVMIYTNVQKSRLIALQNSQSDNGYTITYNLGDYSITTSGKTSSGSNDDISSNYEDLSFEFVAFEPHSTTSEYADLYLKISNPNSDTLKISTTGVYVNNVLIYNYSIQGIIGNTDSVISEQVNYPDTSKKLIGDIIDTFNIEYSIQGESKKRSFSIENIGYSISKNAFVDGSGTDVQKDNIEEASEDNEKKGVGNYAKAISNADDNSLKIKITDISETSSTLTIKCSVENESEKEVNTSFWYASRINDYCLKMKTTSEMTSYTVPGNGVVVASFNYDLSDLQRCGIHEINSVIIVLGYEKGKNILDGIEMLFEDLKISVPINNDIQNAIDNGIEGKITGNIADKVKIKYIGLTETNTYITLYFDVENLTDSYIDPRFWYASTINNLSIKMSSSSDIFSDIYGNKHTLLYLKYKKADLKAGGVENINHIEFKFDEDGVDKENASVVVVDDLEIPIQ